MFQKCFTGSYDSLQHGRDGPSPAGTLGLQQGKTVPFLSGLTSFLFVSPRGEGKRGVRAGLIIALLWGARGKGRQNIVDKRALASSGPGPRIKTEGKGSTLETGRKTLTGGKCVQEGSVFRERRAPDLPSRFLLGRARFSVICRQAIFRIVNFISRGSKSLPKTEMCLHLG